MKKGTGVRRLGRSSQLCDQEAGLSVITAGQVSAAVIKEGNGAGEEHDNQPNRLGHPGGTVSLGQGGSMLERVLHVTATNRTTRFQD